MTKGQTEQNFPNTVRSTIAWLQRLNRPPLPECPIEAAKQGKQPKQPCFLSGKYLKTVDWKIWQDNQPIQEIIDAWFANPKTGIGTLGGWNGLHWLGWIDFDAKDFGSISECDRAIAAWLEQYPVMKSAPMFRTPSGGYRFLVAFAREPENFNANSGFSLKPDGSHHCGELLSKNGGHTLLPPTVGVNGQPYYWVQWGEYPPIVDSPEECGLYPVVKKASNSAQSGAKRNGFVGGDNSLKDLLEREIYPRLSAEQVFNWGGHDFKEYNGGGKLKGNCPWHQSKSGTAFYCDTEPPYLWRCPNCNMGGSAVEYRYQLVGGNGSPRGKDFIEVVEQLASEAGVSVRMLKPDYSPGNGSAANANGVKKTAYKSTGQSPTSFDDQYEAFLQGCHEVASIEDSKKRRFALSKLAASTRMTRKDIEQTLRDFKLETRRNQQTNYPVEEICQMYDQVLEYLVPGVIPFGEITLLSAYAKMGKTLLYTDLLFALCTGESDFLGYTIPKGRALVISVDESLRSTRRKLMKRGFRPEDGDSLIVETSWTIDELDRLEQAIQKYKPDLLVVDSLRSCCRGKEISENDPEFADAIYAIAELIRPYNLACILVHHDRKPAGDVELDGLYRVRGSSSIPGAVNTIIRMEAYPHPEPDSEEAPENPAPAPKKRGRPKKKTSRKKRAINLNDPHKLLMIQPRDAEAVVLHVERDPADMHWLNHGEFGVSEAEARRRRELETSIVAALAQSPRPMRRHQLIDALGLNPKDNPSHRAVFSAIDRLVDRGVIGERRERICENGVLVTSRIPVYFLPGSDGGDGGNFPPPRPPHTHPPEKTKKIQKFTSQSGKGFQPTKNGFSQESCHEENSKNSTGTLQDQLAQPASQNDFSSGHPPEKNQEIDARNPVPEGDLNFRIFSPKNGGCVPSVAVATTSTSPEPSDVRDSSLEDNGGEIGECSPDQVEPFVLEWDDLIVATDSELERLGWSTEKATSYLKETYGKRARALLNDQEILDFLSRLKTMPSPQVDMGIEELLSQKREEILTLAAKYGASNVRVFGSVARGEATDKSDVDFLMDIESGRSLLNRIALIQELEDLLGCKVDVAKPEILHECIRERVLREAVPL